MTIQCPDSTCGFRYVINSIADISTTKCPKCGKTLSDFLLEIQKVMNNKTIISDK